MRLGDAAIRTVVAAAGLGEKRTASRSHTRTATRPADAARRNWVDAVTAKVVSTGGAIAAASCPMMLRTGSIIRDLECARHSPRAPKRAFAPTPPNDFAETNPRDLRRAPTVFVKSPRRSR